MKYKVTTATEALQVFDMLGIKNVSTRRQKKNGTQVYELPIQQMWQTCNPKPLRFACYKTGYVRNVSEYNHSAYQINKTRSIVAKYGISKERILIPNYDERLVYLANFILKNYYQKPTYLINDYVIKCLKEAYYEQNKTGLPFSDIVHSDSSPVDEIQLIINGHRYNLSEALNEGF
jgi:hypothetical protein|tara:strand:+ start:380 stop:907 length:528 start_codon:yes stop_codon:yes gene_type:complete